VAEQPRAVIGARKPMLKRPSAREAQIYDAASGELEDLGQALTDLSDAREQLRAHIGPNRDAGRRIARTMLRRLPTPVAEAHVQPNPLSRRFRWTHFTGRSPLSIGREFDLIHLAISMVSRSVLRSARAGTSRCCAVRSVNRKRSCSSAVNTRPFSSKNASKPTSAVRLFPL
jgi:hypothetical protein